MNDLYRKLVDLYADDQLTEEMVAELTAAAKDDDILKSEMSTLKQTVDLLKTDSGPEFNESDYLRIIFRMQTAGADISFEERESHPGQYQLPM
ncbi:hypothetical protein C0431_07665 [bacterium]|jgi:hypothetical protein|nr:hypothetical protein [bacterium]